jgi:Mrp family chromosome partitioning ATPase
VPKTDYVLTLSGKGGVGKTITAINMASEIAKRKGSAALIDADLSNPNAAELLGVKEQIQVSTQEFTPLKVGNIEFFSMAGISGDKPVCMDASEYAQILRDVLTNTKWASDTAVIDMPAGAHNELNELLTTFGQNLLGSIIVLQPAHVHSAKKMLELHKSEGIPVLGVIENMSYFQCPFHKTPKVFKVFGEVNLEELCKEYDVTALGSIPLSMEIRQRITEGNPLLPEDLMKPILAGAEKALEAKPVGETFVEKLKEKMKAIARETLTEIIFRVVEISNTEIPIAEIQRSSSFPGGRTIEFDITDEHLRNVKVQAFFRLENGLLKLVKNPKTVDDEIRVWDRALIWCILGKRYDTNTPWDLMDAWLMGKLKYYSNASGTQRAVHFLRSVWQEVRNTKSFEKLKPLLEKLA